MQPFALTRINWYRARMQWALRTVGATMLIWGVYLVSKRVLFAFLNGWEMILELWGDDFGSRNPLFAGIAMVGVGIITIVTSGRLARVIVTVPTSACPRCHAEPDPTAPPDRCPECGLRMTSGNG